jgi:hypothetical protein
MRANFSKSACFDESMGDVSKNGRTIMQKVLSSSDDEHQRTIAPPVSLDVAASS